MEPYTNEHHYETPNPDFISNGSHSEHYNSRPLSKVEEYHHEEVNQGGLKEREVNYREETDLNGNVKSFKSEKVNENLRSSENIQPIKETVTYVEQNNMQNLQPDNNIRVSNGSHGANNHGKHKQMLISILDFRDQVLNHKDEIKKSHIFDSGHMYGTSMMNSGKTKLEMRQDSIYSTYLPATNMGKK